MTSLATTASPTRNYSRRFFLCHLLLQAAADCVAPQTAGEAGTPVTCPTPTPSSAFQLVGRLRKAAAEPPPLPPHPSTPQLAGRLRGRLGRGHHPMCPWSAVGLIQILFRLTLKVSNSFCSWFFDQTRENAWLIVNTCMMRPKSEE